MYGPTICRAILIAALALGVRLTPFRGAQTATKVLRIG
jgi:hypothetical protein